MYMYIIFRIVIIDRKRNKGKLKISVLDRWGLFVLEDILFKKKILILNLKDVL